MGEIMGSLERFNNPITIRDYFLNRIGIQGVRFNSSVHEIYLTWENNTYRELEKVNKHTEFRFLDCRRNYGRDVFFLPHVSYVRDCFNREYK